ncbi:MAG: hypothetical protein IKO34_12170 [Bacteroidales bacterium]|nr:hypothetical protein [Bacteroidales bacterium]
MKKYLLGLFLIIMSLTTSVSLFAQVKLSDSGVTKVYENGTRITYFEMAGFPNSPEMREFVTKMVLENPDVNRVIIMRNGETFMYEALQSVDPDMIVDAVNDALKEYKDKIGDYPPPSPQDYEKQPSNVKVTPHKANDRATNVSSSSETRVSQENNPGKKSSNLRAMQAEPRPVKQQSVEDNSDIKKDELVSPAKYNNNSNNK